MELLKSFDVSCILLNVRKIEKEVHDAVLKRNARDVVHLSDELVVQGRLLKAWLTQEAEDELQRMRGQDGSEGQQEVL